MIIFPNIHLFISFRQFWYNYHRKHLIMSQHIQYFELLIVINISTNFTPSYHHKTLSMHVVILIEMSKQNCKCLFQMILLQVAYVNDWFMERGSILHSLLLGIQYRCLRIPQQNQCSICQWQVLLQHHHLHLTI